MDDTSTISTPTYHIFRDKHGIPQFSPKRGTQVLKDALIYAFPTLETELQLMQAALKKFFDSERGIQMIYELPENNLQNSLAKKRDIETSPLQDQKAGLRNWKLGSVSGRPSSRLTSRTTSRAPSRNGSRAGSRPSSRASSCAREGSVDFNGAGIMTTWSLDSGKELERKKKSPYDPIKRRKVAENRGNACEKHRAAKSACDPMTCPQNKMFGKTQDALPTIPQAPISEIQNMDLDPSMANTFPKIYGSTKNISEGPLNAPCIDFVNSPPDTDVFWDASDLDHQENSLNFGHSISSYADSWADSSNTDLLSWSSYSTRLTVPDITPLSSMSEKTSEATLSMTTISTINDMSFEVDARDIPLPAPHTCPMQQYPSLSYPSPADATLMQQMPASAESNEQTLACSEDPFMGWASKKAGQMFDEYNWVLSHVETL